MKNHYQIFNVNISWNLDLNSPDYYDFKSLPNCSLLNPLYYHNSLENAQNGFYKLQPARQFENEVYLETRFLIVKTDFGISAIKEFKLLSEFFQKFLRQLRVISKQATINPNTAAGSATNAVIHKLSKVQVKHLTKKMVVKSYFQNSKVKFDDLSKADDNVLNNIRHQVSHEILIDSIGGFYEKDYRKSILYSCMAVESLLTEEFEKKYTSLMSTDSHDDNFRISSFQTPKGEIRKDPVYKYLISNYSFKNLLHEIPLYLFRQSLLLIMPDLYKDALVLYGTRNKIVHRGEPSDESVKTLKLDIDGAVKAYSIAVNIFNWMNKKEFNNVLLNNIIELQCDS